MNGDNSCYRNIEWTAEGWSANINRCSIPSPLYLGILIGFKGIQLINFCDDSGNYPCIYFKMTKSTLHSCVKAKALKEGYLIATWSSKNTLKLTKRSTRKQIANDNEGKMSATTYLGNNVVKFCSSTFNAWIILLTRWDEQITLAPFLAKFSSLKYSAHGYTYINSYKSISRPLHQSCEEKRRGMCSGRFVHMI